MNNNQLNNQLDWVWVLGCKDLLCYFNVRELKEFSTLCQYLPNKLRPVLFNNLDFTKFKPVRFGFLNEVNEIKFSTNHSSMDLVKLYFVPFHPYICGLEFGSFFNRSILLAIPSIFHNLKYLKLCGLHISYSSLFHLIQKLASLESLSLHSLLMCVLNESDSSILQYKFPEWLKQLAVVRCSRLIGEVYYDSDNETTEDLSYIGYCYFPGQFLPNLQEFIIDQGSSNLTQNEFLSLNPQLTSLQTRFETLNQKCFDYLEQLRDLTNLQVNYQDSQMENFNLFVIPPLNHIKTLTFIYINEEIIPSIVKLSLSCPNTTHLTVPFIQGFATSLNEIVLGLQYLQLITITELEKFELFFEVEILWNQVKYVELRGFDPLKIDLTKFESGTQLKRVTIKFSEEVKHNTSLIGTHYNGFQDWNCLYFHESIQCYKI